MIKSVHITALILGATLLAWQAPAWGAVAEQGLPGEGRTPDNPADAIRSPSFTPAEDGPRRGESVANRPRRQYDPVPVPVGSFQMFPAVEIGEFYDSNIYATENNEQDDLVTVVVPTMALISNWGRHEMRLDAAGAGYRFAKNTDENSINGEVRAEGRYDITYETWVRGNAGVSAQTERRGDPSSPNAAAEPVRYTTASAGLHGYRGRGKLRIGGGYDVVSYSFTDPKRIGGGTIDQSGRDRTDHIVDGEMNYKWRTENFLPRLRGAYNWRDYKDNPVRDSSGYTIGVGARHDFGVLTGNTYIGYMAQSYPDMAVEKIEALDFGVDVLWNVTALTSIGGRVGRFIGEGGAGNIRNPNGASGYLGTEAALNVVHELRRDTILALNVENLWRDYRGPNLDRNDTRLGLGGGVRYLMNRNLYGDMTYNYVTQKTNISDGHSKHTVLLRVGVQY